MRELRYLLIGIALAALIWGAISCSNSPTEPETTVPVSLEVSFKPSALTTLIDRVELQIVYLRSNDTLNRPLAISNGAILDTLVLPPGDHIEFYLAASSAQEVILYEGYDTVNVVVGGSVVSTIFLEPVVSMLRPSPLYQEISISEGEQAAVGINLYNVTDVFGATFRLAYDPSLLSFTTIELGPFLGDDVLPVVNDTTGYVAVGIVRTQDEDNPVGGVSGSGRLATIVFQGIAAGSSVLWIDPVRATFVDSSLTPIPEMSQMRFDTGEIVVNP